MTVSSKIGYQIYMGIVKAFLRRENWEAAGDRGRAVSVLLTFCRKMARIFIDDLPKSLFSLSFFFDSMIFDAVVLLLVDRIFFFESRVSSCRRTSLELDQVALRPAVDYFERTRSRALLAPAKFGPTFRRKSDPPDRINVTKNPFKNGPA